MRARETSLCFAIGLVAATCLFSNVSTAAAQTVNFRARLILASNQAAAQDMRLEDLEYKLRRVFGFEYYSLLAEGEGVADVRGQTSIRLDGDSRLQIAAAPARGGQVRANVQWTRNGVVVLNTTVVMGRGAGVILGGVSHEKGTLLIALDTR